MSFSSEIKEKLCRTIYECPSCAMNETAGALAFGGIVSENGISFRAENKCVINRVKQSIFEAFGINAEIKSMPKLERLNIEDRYKTENIIGGISLCSDIPFLCCRAAFVRGAFLGGGSVTDPNKGYHMEFNTRNEKAAERLCEILKTDDFSSKITHRKGNYVVYIKGSEEIADILGYMGAPQGALELFSIQVEREMRNVINRRVNCENANTNKAARASSKHLFAIKKIRASGEMRKLPEVLREIAELREEYPEDSLKELGEKTNPPIGKSGVNHRLNRILEIADNI